VLAFVVNSLVSKRQVEALGAGKPLFLLAAAALSSQIVNAGAIDVPGSEGQALKSVSMLVSLMHDGVPGRETQQQILENLLSRQVDGIVWAIAEGRQCAREVDRYLMGETDLP